ncbi:PH domain-containing protein [uncultured Vagococcus sp.]|uniref:PH domain-containing protein n=1 Tax=uncultured Vagococcus sp. TaxID=189676 RepID=UPI0028D2D414|nr:PH domain-containing protein [uncultured Vagococcus sp.]
MNSKNIFKQAVNNMYQRQTITPNDTHELTAEEKKQLFTQTQMYIQLEEIVDDLSKDLARGEEIAGYIPFTNEGNSAVATSGIMGMTYVTTAKAKKYRDNFHDLRGNRLLIFTNQRMIFTILIEFLEERRYYSYPYDKIQAIRFEKHAIGYFDRPKGKFLPKRQKTYWYTLDFQSQTNIFTEVLQLSEVKKFQELVDTLPALKAITIDENMHRDTPFNYLFSNTKLAIWLFNGIWITILIFFILAITIQIIRGNGPWSQWFEEIKRLNTAFLYIVPIE